MKKYNFLFTIPPDSADSADSADSIFGSGFHSDSIGYSLFFRSVRSGSDPVLDLITVGYNLLLIIFLNICTIIFSI